MANPGGFGLLAGGERAHYPDDVVDLWAKLCFEISDTHSAEIGLEMLRTFRPSCHPRLARKCPWKALKEDCDLDIENALVQSVRRIVDLCGHLPLSEYWPSV